MLGRPPRAVYHALQAGIVSSKGPINFDCISIKNIRDDNGVYASKCIQDSYMRRHQKSTFWVVGTHWQNGIAEHSIGNIIRPARAILLHAMSKWPDATAKDMWPFVIQHMVIHFCNASIRCDKNTAPLKLYAGDWMTSMFLDALPR